MPEWPHYEGEFEHLYTPFHKCGICRFYSSELKIVEKHRTNCDGKTKWFCLSCRFDCQTHEELINHRKSGDCVDEISQIANIYHNMNYDILDRVKENGTSNS